MSAIEKNASSGRSGMTIGKKLYVNFGAVLAMVVVLFLVNLVAVQREHSAKAAASQALKMAETTDHVRFQIMQNRLYLSNYLLSGDTREVERLNDGARTLQDALQTARNLSNSEQQKDALEKVQNNEQNWAREFASPLVDKRKDVDAGNATVAELQIFYLQKDASSWVKNATDHLDVADQQNAKVLEQRRKSDETAATATIVIALISTLLALALGIAIAYTTARSITEPLGNLMKVARQIGNAGDLDHEIDLSRKDEIGELAKTFASMVTYLKEMATVSEAIAGGNLTVEVQPRSKNDTLGNAFVRMTAGLRNLVRNVRDASSQVASASNQVAGASDESAKISLQTSSAIDEVTSTMHEMSVNVQNMVKSTQVQASSVSETSASIDQMVASIQRVADTAKVLLDISNRSREEVHSGITTMDKATDGLNRINSTIQASGEIIDVLGQRADDIGKIIEVIDDLAEQTNLLALNAAIEAARAGEHGLGFAVVADEVRKLAEKSAQSTKEISELIQSIQKEARKAVENMDRSTSIVNEGLGLGSELNTALRKISNVVTEVYKFAQEIGAATNEQSHGSSQIARATTRLNEITHEINSAVEEQASGAHAVVKAMERMRELVQQTTSGSTELAASAEQMSKMSRDLLESMDRFTLEQAERHQGEREDKPAGKMHVRQAAAGTQK
jgi:methyl-accepting chemotaxis protein